MTRRFAKRSRKAILFIAFNLSILICAYLAIFRPLVALLETQTEQIDMRADETFRYQALADQELRVRQLRGREDKWGTSTIFLAGSGEGAAGAALQARLKAVGARSGLHIRSMAAIEPYFDSGIYYLGAQMDVSGPTEAIYRALHNLENEVAPALFVKAVSIRAPAAANEIPQQEPELDAQIEIYGAMRHSDAKQ